MAILGVCWVLVGCLSLLFWTMTDRGSSCLDAVRAKMGTDGLAGSVATVVLTVVTWASFWPGTWLLIAFGLEPGRWSRLS